jgi:hypothetical protein
LGLLNAVKNTVGVKFGSVALFTGVGTADATAPAMRVKSKPFESILKCVSECDQEIELKVWGYWIVTMVQVVEMTQHIYIQKARK